MSKQHLKWTDPAEEKQAPNWHARLVVAGMIAGFVLVALFARAPHWAAGLLALSFVSAGGYVGDRLYLQYWAKRT